MDIEQDQNKVQAEQFKIKGNEFFKKQKYHNAIEEYSKAIKIYNMDPLFYGNRAACYLALKKFKQCIEDCDKALEIDQKQIKCLRRKATCLQNLGQLDSAKAIFEDAIKIDANDVQLKAEYEECQKLCKNLQDIEDLYSKSQFKECIPLCEEITQKLNSYQQIQLKYIECLAKDGQTEKADEQLKKVEQYDQANIYYLKGLINLYSGESEKAKKLFTDGMKYDPDNQKCKNALNIAKNIEKLKQQGNEVIKAQKYDEAIKIYTQALELDPFNKKMNSVLYSNRALGYLKLNKTDEAMKDCNKSIELNDKYFRAFLRRAEIKMKIGDFDGAVGDYYRVKEIDPTQNTDDLIKKANAEGKIAKKKDYYKILDVDKNFTPDQLKKQYKKLALKWHPDKHNTSPEDKAKATQMFRDISEAYQVLNDPNKRQLYDSGVDPDGPGGFTGEGFDPSEIFKSFFGGSEGGGINLGSFFGGPSNGNVKFSFSSGSPFGGFGGDNDFSSFGGFDQGGSGGQSQGFPSGFFSSGFPGFSGSQGQSQGFPGFFKTSNKKR